MTASPGSLDGLLNYTFTQSQWSAISNLSATATAGYISGTGLDETYVPPALETATATATGTPFLPNSLGYFQIVGYSDANNTVTINSVTEGVSVGTITYYVIGYTAGALLLGAVPASDVATFSTAGLASLDETTSILATSAIAENTTITFDATGAFDGVACFGPGTRIRTTRGDVAVEDLRIGDVLPTLVTGRLSSVRWIGRRTLDVANQFRPWDMAPVRVRAHAFGPGQPARDLILSPDHAVMLDGALIPIRYLRNGATIVQEAARRITYFHVELASHDVLLAEGLPAESFLDTGNRGAFENAPGAVDLRPDFARRVWAAQGCLPLLTDGPVVAAARQRLARRATELGWERTREPALRIEAGGHVLPAVRTGARWTVTLPPDAADVRLVSRSTVPAETAPGGDRRRLGVALAEIRLDGAVPRPAAFGAGWHADEGQLRWTDGDARLYVDGARDLSFALVWHEDYWEARAA